MYECFHCQKKSVCWNSDYNYEDFGYEGEGIVQICHCTNCGAEIEYRIPITNENIDKLKEKEEKMIRIHFDNKKYVDIKMTLNEFIECANKFEKGQFNWMVLNNHTMLSFDKVVYVEEGGK